MLETLSKPFAHLFYHYTKTLEKKLGYLLILPEDTNWIAGTMLFDMSLVWKRNNIDAIGLNYFTIGAIQDGLSTRYIETSPYYQAWFGGYIVKFSEDRKWTAEDHFNLGLADQKQWLSSYGDPHPFVQLDQAKLIKKITLDKWSTDLYEVSGWSNSDVGNKPSKLFVPIIFSIFSNMLMISNPNLHLKHKNFLPKPPEFLTPYQKIYLKGYVAIVELENHTKAVLYINGASFKDKTGKDYDNFEKLKTSFLNLLTSIKIEKV